jgi:hypothetical protein
VGKLRSGFASAGRERCASQRAVSVEHGGRPDEQPDHEPGQPNPTNQIVSSDCRVRSCGAWDHPDGLVDVIARRFGSDVIGLDPGQIVLLIGWTVLACTRRLRKNSIQCHLTRGRNPHSPFRPRRSILRNPKETLGIRLKGEIRCVSF